MQDETGLQALTPMTIRPPFAAYSHGTHVPAAHEWVFTSGQLGIAPDDSIPDDAEAQAGICFAAIDAILGDAGFDRRQVDDHRCRFQMVIRALDQIPWPAEGGDHARKALGNLATRPDRIETFEGLIAMGRQIAEDQQFRRQQAAEFEQAAAPG